MRMNTAKNRTVFTLFCFLLTVFLTAASVTAQYLELKRVIGDATAHDEWATQVAFTPDGAQVVSAGLDGCMRFVDTSTGKLARELRLGRGAGALSLAVSGDGQYVAAGDTSGTVSVWNSATWKLEREIKADARAVNAVAFAGDSKALAAGGDEGIARIWRLDAAVPVTELSAGGTVVSLAFVPGGQLLAVGTLNRKELSKSGVGVWRWQAKERLRFFGGAPAVRALAVSADGRLLAAAQFRPTTLASIKPAEGGTFEVSVHALGEQDDPGEVGVWDLMTGQTIRVFSAELGADSLAFSGDGQLLAAGGEHGVMLFDTGILLERGRIDTRTRSNTIAFDRTGTRLAFAREREPVASPGDGGLDKLFDPFFVAAAMAAKDAIHSGALATGSGKSVTGGSTVEVWSVGQSKSPEAARLWEAIRLSLRNKDEARKAVEQVVADFPKFAEARRVLVVLSQGVSAGKLLALAQESVKGNTDCAGCYRTLGDVQFAGEDFAGAVVAYRRALELNPESGLIAGRLASALSRLALVLTNPDDRKKMKEAYTLLAEAIRLRPAEEQYLTNFSSLFYFDGDFDTSIKLLSLAERLRPDHARIYYNLGHSYRQKGQLDKALRAYRRYVELGEPGEESRVERAKKIIEELTKRR